MSLSAKVLANELFKTLKYQTESGNFYVEEVYIKFDSIRGSSFTIISGNGDVYKVTVTKKN